MIDLCDGLFTYLPILIKRHSQSNRQANYVCMTSKPPYLSLSFTSFLLFSHHSRDFYISISPHVSSSQILPTIPSFRLIKLFISCLISPPFSLSFTIPSSEFLTLHPFNIYLMRFVYILYPVLCTAQVSYNWCYIYDIFLMSLH